MVLTGREVSSTYSAGARVGLLCPSIDGMVDVGRDLMDEDLMDEDLMDVWRLSHSPHPRWAW